MSGRLGQYLGLPVGIEQVMLGQVSGWSIMSARGERESIQDGISGEDLWRGNELTPAPTSHIKIPTPSSSGEQFSFVCEDANDTAAGTGVREVTLKYINVAGEELTQSKPTNGLTEVDFDPVDAIFAQDFYSSDADLTGAAVATSHIKLYKKGSPGLVYNMIAAGGNRSMVPLRMVPAGKVLLLRGWGASEGNNKESSFRMRSTDYDGVLQPGIFTFKGYPLYLIKSWGVQELFDVCPPFSIVKPSVWATTVNAAGSGGWWGFLVPESALGDGGE